MDCLCGKKMVLLGTAIIPSLDGTTPRERIHIWVCPPDGCGRLYLEGSEENIDGTWYTAEQNQRRDTL
jgi:hypothetical protein